MSYVIPAIEGEPSITWNGKVYWPVTQWKVASTKLDGWLTAAVRFLMEDGATETSFHIVAQYTAWTTTGRVDTGNGYMLLRKLRSAIDSDTNDLGVKTAGSFVGGSASDFNKNQRQGYVYAGVVTGGSKVWYNMPYFMTEAWTTANGSTAAGTVSDGVTVYSSNFYTGYSYWQNGKPVQVEISDSYTTPLCTYEITYNANGGSGTTATQIKTRGTNIALSANSFTRSNYHFVEWNTAADGSGVSYAEGATYSTDAALTLYAIWEINYVLPVFSNVQLYRVDSTGTADDYGDYVEVSFDYNFGGDLFSQGLVTIQYRKKGTSTYSQLYEANLSATKTITTRTGTWSAYSYKDASHKQALSTDDSWEFHIHLRETTTGGDYYYSAYYDTILTVALFPLDIYDGVSVAIGEPAPESLPTDGGGNTIVDGILTLGKAWDLDMSLDLANTVDSDLNTAITNAGISANVFHDNGDLSTKLLLKEILDARLTCVESSGGQTWQQVQSAPGSNSSGWYEQKWSDGRLIVEVWDWYNMTASTRSVTYNFPTGPTAFVDYPRWQITAGKPGSATTAVLFTIVTFTTNTSAGLYIYKWGSNAACPFKIHMEGRWK